MKSKAWSEANSGRVDGRLETEEGLRMQIAQVGVNGADGRTNRRIAGRQTAYRKLDPAYAQLVMDRASGLTD